MAENIRPSASKKKRTNNPDATRRKTPQSARYSRRSTTPFIPYEPPTDVFTPPREVFLSPMTNTMSKSSKRKRKASTLTIVTAVKQELPDIDLTLPMPPPSPSDDPLLLSGPPEFDFLSELTPPPPPRRRRTRSIKREMSVQVQTVDEDLPPSSPPVAVDDDEPISPVKREMSVRFQAVDEYFPAASPLVSPIAVDDDDDDEVEEPISFIKREMSVRVQAVDEVLPPPSPLELPIALDEDEDEDEEPTFSIKRPMSVRVQAVDEDLPPSPQSLIAVDDDEAEEPTFSIKRETSVRVQAVDEALPSESPIVVDDEEAEPTFPIKREVSVRVQAADEDLPPSHPESPIAVDDEEAVGVFDWDSNNINDDNQISDESVELSPGIVKITSADLHSAARAAAFLTQHDYDCFTNVEIKQRYQEAKHRRKSEIIEDSTRRSSSRRRDVFEIYGGDDHIEKREWTKEDWKYLDACFTDQRLEVGSRLATGAEQKNMLASVDMVSIDDVVDKFVMSQGGYGAISRFGELWSRENLLERTRALQKKQRSGKFAPPTSPYTPLSIVNSRDDIFRRKYSRSPSMQVPDFTPLQRHATLLQKSRPRPTLPQFDLGQKKEEPLIVIPPTLLAPRYSHLLEEAISISQERSTTPSPSPEPEQTFSKFETNDTFSDVSSTIAISQDGWTTPSPEQETFSQSEVKKNTSHSSDVQSTTTIGKRVKGILFSYLPTLPKLSSSSSSSSSTKPPPISVQPSLPIPPIEILSKPRGPITTPARAPIVKPKHPKELVVLHQPPQPPPVSQIPRLKKPQRLVELRPPPPPPTPPPIPRPRRSSGSSVKDLVRGFEEIQSVSTSSSRDRDNIKLKYGFGWKTTGDQKRPQWKP